MHCESLDSPMTVSISAARARPSSGSAENALSDLSGPWEVGLAAEGSLLGLEPTLRRSSASDMPA